MPNYTVTSNIDTLLKSTTNAAARTNLGLGDAATKNTGTTAGTVAAGDDSRITGAVQTTRTITAGTGLTGGGDLSANRTLAVSYGTTAGTAAQGNDARLSDARTPTAHAASHAAAGSDPITITATQISGSLTQNTTGTASNVTGTVAIANGGTGQTTANAALNALLPAQASNNTKLLSTDGTNASWTTAFKFSNTKVVGVDAATIQGCIDLVASPTALTQVQILIPPGVYNENLTLKPCVSLSSTGLNNGLSSLVRINGTHTLTGGTSPGDNIIQLNGLRMDYQAGTSPTLTISATGTTPLLVYMQDCMIGNSNASTSSVGILVNQYCSLRCNNVKSISNSTSGSGGTHVEVNGGTFYGDQFSTEYGTLALRLSGTGGSFKPYVELKQCSLSCVGSNVVDITSTTALFSAGWTGFTNNATTGNGINIAAGSVIGVFNSVFVITAGASNYVVTGGAGGVYYSLNNSYSNSTGVTYETKVNATISQFLYSSSIPSALTALTGDVTASGTGSQAASVVRIQGRNVSSTAPTNGQVLAWNGTAWTPAAAGGTGTVTSVGVSGGTTGLTTSGGPVTSSGTITLAGTLGVANGGTGQTTQQAALNALAGAVTSGQYLRGTGANVTLSAIQAADVPTLNQNTTGTASNVTGTVAIANGGTGQTTAANAINALVPAQSGQSGKVLTTNGSVVSWGTAGAGGITALTGDVSASGSGSVSSTIIALRGRAVASTAPTTGQVLGWNGSQWEPTSAGGSVSYDILKILFTGPTSGTYNVPSGYKYADIYAAGGGGGGGAGAYINGPFAVSGGGGGACGVFGRREKVYVENAFITYDIGAGGAGGYMDVNGNATNGLAGQGTLVLLQAGGPQFPILDCGFYINQQTATGGQGGSTSSSGGGSLSFFDIWAQDAQTGGGGLAGGPGQPPTNNTIYSSNVYVSAGAGGGGVDASLTLYDGGNINDRNYILYSSGSAIQYKGTAGSSASIDATSPMSISPIHFGGAGGAAANTSTAIYNGTFYRAGNGANGQFGCGGGGGGCMYDDLGAGPGSYAGGNGGNGGAGFLLMYLYK